nr:DNA-directed DNA polymerase [Tanacetum cinerariifolium]
RVVPRNYDPKGARFLIASRFPTPPLASSPVIVEPLRIEFPFLEDQFQEDPPVDPPEVPMADNRIMTEFLQAPTEGYEDAIVILEIAANNFELKHSLINLVQNKQFFGNDKEDPHAHIHYFNKITSTMRVPNVPNKKNQSSAPASSSTPAPVKAIEPNYVTCGGTHSYQNCPATSGNVYRDNIQEYVTSRRRQLHRPQVNQPLAYQAPAYQAPIPQTLSVTQTDFESYIKANDAILRNIQSQGQGMQNQCQGLQTQIANLTDMLSKFVSSNTASSLGLGTLLSNTVTNPKEDLKGITIRSGVAYQGPPIPIQSKIVKQRTEVTKDQVQTPSSQSTAPVQPPVIQSETQTPISEPVVAPVSVPIPYPARRDNERRRDQANEQIEKFYEIFKEMSFEISFTDALILMPKFASTLKALIGNKEKLSEMARTPMNEHCSAVILNKLPRKLGDPGKFLIPYEFPGMDERCFLKTGRALIDVHKGKLTLRIGSEAITYNLDQTVRYSTNYNQMTANKIDVICEMYSQEVLGFSDVTGDILLLEAILNSEPLPPLPNHEQYLPSYKKELKVCEAKTIKTSVDEPPEVELKDLPPHLEYAFLEGDNKLPVIIAKELGDEEKFALIKVLKSHKRAIAWKLSDIQGINPKFCTQKILIEENYKPTVQHQRRVNPKIYDVIKKEVEKLLDAGLIYLISDSPWVSPMLERLAGNEYYCFLDGFFGYFQIPIDPRVQEKTTFTCPYGTFAYRRMPFGLCNAPGTF